MKMHYAFRLLLASLVVLPIATAALAQDTKVNGDPVNGKKLFLADGCYQCHGTFGQGAGNAGPRLAPNPPPVSAIMRQLRRPAARMPVYTPAVLSDAQAGDIIAYLQSIKPGKAAKDIPILNLR